MCRSTGSSVADHTKAAPRSEKSYIEWHVETMALYAQHGIALPIPPPKVIYPGTSIIAPGHVIQVKP